MSKFQAHQLSLPSSLSVFPTRVAPQALTGVGGEVDHLRLEQEVCSACGGWQTLESVTVWSQDKGTVERQIIRCQGKRVRGVARCAPQVVSETLVPKSL